MAAQELCHFIAAGPGAWGGASNVFDAVANMRKNLPQGLREQRTRAKKTSATVYASNQPLKVETDVMLRIYPQEGALFVKFEVT